MCTQSSGLSERSPSLMRSRCEIEKMTPRMMAVSHEKTTYAFSYDFIGKLDFSSSR